MRTIIPINMSTLMTIRAMTVGVKVSCVASSLFELGFEKSARMSLICCKIMLKNDKYEFNFKVISR